MRLVSVNTVDFRRSELTNMQMLWAKEPRLKKLQRNDVVLLRNLKGDQLVFIHGFYLYNGANSNPPGPSGPAKYLRTERLRLLNDAVWDPFKVRDYARQVGIQLTNLDLFESHINGLIAALKKAMRRSAGTAS